MPRWRSTRGATAASAASRSRSLRLLGLAGAAVGADAEDFGIMSGELEVELGGDLAGPLLHGTAVNLFGAAAFGAHEVMVVVRGIAVAVQRLAGGHVEGIDRVDV